MSDRWWKTFAENGVQYINRLQPSEIESIFRNVGLVLEADSVTVRSDLSDIQIADRFSGYTDDDLSTAVKNVIFRSPTARISQ